jgi:hypothetical protein
MKQSWTFLKWYTVIAVLLCSLAVASLCACTENTRSRVWGGKMTIELPKGQKLVEATWKGDGNSLWYLTEPMDADYTPKIKIFQEDSRFGVLEGSVVFVESK